MPNKELAVFNDFTGGWNTDKSPYNLSPKELALADNVDYSERGSIKKRENIDPYNNNSYEQQVERLFEWRTTSGNTELLAVMEDEKLYRIIDEDDIEEIRQNIGYNISYFVLNEYLYYVDGNEYYRVDEDTFTTEVVSEESFIEIIETAEEFSAEIDTNISLENENIEEDSEEVTYADDPDVTFSKDTDYEMNYDDGEIKPLSDGDMEENETYYISYEYETEDDNDLEPIRKCKYIIRHTKSNRIFAAGNPDDPSALYWSEMNEPTYFKEVSKLFPTTNDGPIQGLSIMGELLLVFFQNSIWAWRGIDPEADAVWEKLPVKHGTSNHRTIELTEGVLTFVGSSNIYGITSGEGLDNITDNRVSNVIKDIGNKNDMHAYYDGHNNKYMLAYSESSGRNDKILTLDFEIGAFGRWDGLGDINDFCLTENNELLMASDNYIYKMYQDTDYSDIDFYVKTKKEFLQSPYLEKTLKKIYARLSDNENTNITLILDDEEINIEAGYEIIRKSLYNPSVNMQLEIRNDSKEPVTLFNWGVEFKPVMTYQSKEGC